jgi:nifR3 family TIM-barrel protein
MINIREILQENPVVLAPMAGVSDRPSRLIARKYGCGLVYTEMISAKALTYRNPKTFALMNMEDELQPVNVQIFGSEPAVMAEGAAIMVEHGAQMIDINMGCPVPKVVNNQEGSALMKNPQLAAEIVQTMTKAVQVPITVKIRKGWDEQQVNAVEFAKILEQSGAAAVAVHGRTRAQMYTGEADWTLIGEIKKNPRMRIPVIGNGDVTTPQRAKECFEKYGVDGIMIGRASFGRPWIFKEVKHYLETGEELPALSFDWKMEVLRQQFIDSVNLLDERRGILHVRRHLANSPMFKGIPNFKETRIAMLRTETVKDLFSILDYIKGNYAI